MAISCLCVLLTPRRIRSLGPLICVLLFGSPRLFFVACLMALYYSGPVALPVSFPVRAYVRFRGHCLSVGLSSRLSSSSAVVLLFAPCLCAFLYIWRMLSVFAGCRFSVSRGPRLLCLVSCFLHMALPPLGCLINVRVFAFGAFHWAICALRPLATYLSLVVAPVFVVLPPWLCVSCCPL